MAARSIDRPGCAAIGHPVIDWPLRTGLDGWPHRRRRPRRRTGRLVRHEQIDRIDAGSPLDQRPESLSAAISRGAGRSSDERFVRPPPRCRVADVHLPSPSLEPTPAVVATSSMDRVTSLRPREGKSGVVDPGRQPRLRGVHAAVGGANHQPDVARSRTDHRRPFLSDQGAGRFVSATPGASDGRGGRRGRSRPSQPGGVRAPIRKCQTRFNGADRTGLRSQSGCRRVPAAPVQHTRSTHTIAPEPTSGPARGTLREIAGCQLLFLDRTRCPARGI